MEQVVCLDEKIFRILREINIDIDEKAEQYGEKCYGSQGREDQSEFFEFFCRLCPRDVGRYVSEIGVNEELTLPALVDRAEKLALMTMVMCHVASWQEEKFPEDYSTARKGTMTLFDALRNKDSTPTPSGAEKMRYRQIWFVVSDVLTALEKAGLWHIEGPWGNLRSDRRVDYLQKFTHRAWTELFECVRFAEPRLSFAAAFKRQIGPKYADKKVLKDNDYAIRAAFRLRCLNAFEKVLSQTHPGYKRQQRSAAACQMLEAIPDQGEWIDYLEPTRDPIPLAIFNALFPRPGYPTRVVPSRPPSYVPGGSDGPSGYPRGDGSSRPAPSAPRGPKDSDKMRGAFANMNLCQTLPSNERRAMPASRVVAPQKPVEKDPSTGVKEGPKYVKKEPEGAKKEPKDAKKSDVKTETSRVKKEKFDVIIKEEKDSDVRGPSRPRLRPRQTIPANATVITIPSSPDPPKQKK